MKPKLLIYPILISLFLFTSCGSSDWTVYVSPDGSDYAPGTIEQPLATLQRAHELAAGSYGKRTVKVYLREGRYYISEPLVFTPEHSGSEKWPVTYAAYPEECVVLSTSSVLDGLFWESYRDGIQKAKIVAPFNFDQLYVNGEKLPMARYPDFDPQAHYYNGSSADALSPERIASWRKAEGGYIHALHKHEWGGFHYRIDGKDKRGELILDGGFQNNRRMGMHSDYRMVENIFEELDAPGEWFYDREVGILYIYPPQGIELATARIEVPQSEGFFEFRGTAENPVRYITLEGLTLEHTRRTFMKTDEPLLRSDWTIYRGAAILFEGAEECGIRNCTLRDLGGNALFFSGYNRRCTVSGSHFMRIGASAVCFVGMPDAVRSPLFEYNETADWTNIDLTPGPASDNYPAACTVDNNLIHDIGLVEKQVAGVQISMAKQITVSRNSIYRTPRAGINISEGTWGGHLIEWNDVFDTVLETGDHGAFNSWGRDRFWFSNRSRMDSITAAHPGLALLDAVETTVMRNNRWRCDHGWDIDLDDGSSNYHIYNNLCLNGGLKLREGFNRIVENNIMVNNSFHPHVWFGNSEDVFRHNIVTRGYYPIRILQWGREVDYNFFPDQSSLARAQAAGTDAHSLAGEPQFLDSANGDYRVAEDSPALAVGFKNFPMDRFGVQEPALKSLAETPLLPTLSRAAGGEHERSYDWLGGQVKELSTEGERSATGMNGTYGVLVTEAVPGSGLSRAGIRPNDVILKFNSRNTDSWADLESQVARTHSGDRVRLTIFRDQQSQTITFIYP